VTINAANTSTLILLAAMSRGRIRNELPNAETVGTVWSNEEERFNSLRL
jgi:hypothetical protein